jgi:hypothetical protein
MNFYPEGYTVELVVAFTDLNGAAVTPTVVNATLTDGEDAVLANFDNIVIEDGAASATVTVPSGYNLLDDGELRAARILHVELVTAAGSIKRSLSYVVESEQRLEIMTNTFQTYEAAEIQALDIPNISGWSSASEDQRKAALVEAYRRLTNIPMKFPTYGAQRNWDGFNKLIDRDLECETIITREGWNEVTPDLYSSFPSGFKKALRRAQFLEANELLQGDSVGAKHRAGIVTETIGESSVTLRAGRIDFGVASQTLQALTGYIYFNMRIKRA